jgi:hypothetical protein
MYDANDNDACMPDPEHPSCETEDPGVCEPNYASIDYNNDNPSLPSTLDKVLLQQYINDVA